jgi:hypothetical protein
LRRRGGRKHIIVSFVSGGDKIAEGDHIAAVSREKIDQRKKIPWIAIPSWNTTERTLDIPGQGEGDNAT